MIDGNNDGVAIDDEFVAVNGDFVVNDDVSGSVSVAVIVVVDGDDVKKDGFIMALGFLSL